MLHFLLSVSLIRPSILFIFGLILVICNFEPRSFQVPTGLGWWWLKTVTNHLTFLSWWVKFMLPPLESGLVYDWFDHLGMVRKDALPALGLGL